MDRRTFLSLGASSALVTGSGSTSGAIFTTESLIVEHVPLTYQSLPKALDGLRFGFLSDFHLGGWVKTELVRKAFDLASQENISFLLHGGDYLWVPDTYGRGHFDRIVNDTFHGNNDEELAESIFHTLATVANNYSFPLGSYGVLGNHDRWSNATACTEYLPQGKIAVLENNSAFIEKDGARIELYGSADYWTGVPKVPNFKNDKNIFRILLTHNPDFGSRVFHQHKVPFHLCISGHTHGGQVKMPFVGALSYNIQDSRYGEGLVDYGETKFYTSRGIGVVEVPFRFLCPPEVTIFEVSTAN